MKIPLNDLSRHTPSFIEDVQQSIAEVIVNGQFFNGPLTLKFCSQMSERLNSQNFLPLGNGTDALILALEALGLPKGTRVAVAPNAGGYGSVAAVRAGLIPYFVDIEKDSLQMSVESLRTSLASNTEIGAVILTHLYGLVGDVSNIKSLCEEYGVPLIEDCAQAFGAIYAGNSVGTFGNIATFSFYPTKNLGGFGDGGGITCKDPLIFERIRSLSQYGWSDRYKIDLNRGFNSRLDEIQAAVLVRQLEKLDSDNARRREIIVRYSEALNTPRRMIFADDSTFIGHLAVVSSPVREEDMKNLGNLGVGCGIHYPTLDFQQNAWEATMGSAMCPVAEEMNKTIFTLPCFPSMTDDEIDAVSDALKKLDS